MGFFDTIKILWKYMRPYRWRFLFGVLTLLALDLITAYPPILLKQFIDEATRAFKGERSFSPFLKIGLIYTGVALAQGLFRYLWRMWLIKPSHLAAMKIREDYFAKLQKLPPSFYDRRPIGDLMSLATNDIEAIRFAIGPGLLVFADSIFLFIALPPAMLMLSPRLTMISLLPLAFIPFVIMVAEKMVHERFAAVQTHFSKLTSFAQENIEGMRVVKSFVREWTQIDRFASLGKQFVRLHVKLSYAQAVFEPVFNIGFTLAMVNLILFASKDVIDGSLPLGTFVAFTRYIDLLVWPLSAFGLAVTYYQRGKGSLERIIDVLSQDEIEKSEKRDAALDLPITPGAPMLELKNLTFSYQADGQAVLKNVSLKIGAGERVALVGEVGSGKSTFVKLITGLYDTPPGTVFWYGTDVTSLSLKQRRELVSVVPQEVVLFTETIEKNISLGALVDAEKKDIEAAVRNAALADEFSQWTGGMNVGEKGSNLSGGQRARVTLARAFVRDAELLILDDALSSVDSETELRLLDALESSVRKDQTLIMITHRFSRLFEFDRVFVLKNGELVQSGQARELENEPGIFRQMLELQRMEAELVRE